MKQDNENDLTTKKVTVKDDYHDYEEIEKSKEYIIQKFGGTGRTFLSTFISSIYNIVFIILIIYFNEKDTKNTQMIPSCKKLKRCNRVLCIGLGVSLVFVLVCTIIQIKYQGREKIVSYLLLIRTLYNFFVGTGLLIYLTVVYFHDDIDDCGNVKTVDFVYIILEWVILVGCCIFHYSIVIFFLCCKAKRTFWDGEGDVDPEEIKKVI